MNKEIKHKYLDRKVIILYSHSKTIIGYVLQSFTPIYKRTLCSEFIDNREQAKRFLNF